MTGVCGPLGRSAFGSATRGLTRTVSVSPLLVNSTVRSFSFTRSASVITRNSFPILAFSRSFVVCASSAERVSAQNAIRDLPADYVPGVTFTVSIALNPPGGTAVVGVEEQPPIGWVVSRLSHSGVFDTQSQKVKWGPFFGGSVPPAVSSFFNSPSPSGSLCGAGFVPLAIWENIRLLA